MTSYLVGRGYVVEIPGEWETRKAFCDRLDVSESAFDRRMEQARRIPSLPRPPIDQGPDGRLVRLRGHSAFDAYKRCEAPR